MTNTQHNTEKDFLVKESKSINLMIGIVMLIVFLVSMLYGDYGWSNYIWGLCLFLIPGAIAIGRSRRNATIIKINKNGFYYGGKFITNWHLFYDAKVTNDMEVGSFKDNFILQLRYYSADFSLIYTRFIPLTNNQDKAEEEIIEAIKFYYKTSRSSTSVNEIRDIKNSDCR